MRRIFGSGVFVVVVVACSTGGGGGSAAAVKFSKSVEVGVPSMQTTGALPVAEPGGIQAVASSSAVPTTVAPGQMFDVVLAYKGTPPTVVNISFGGGVYFTVNVSTAAGSSTPQGLSAGATGQVSVPVRVKPDVCNDLAEICHTIACQEQGGNPFGVTVNQQIVLNCTGGKDCNGNQVTRPGDGGTDAASSDGGGSDGGACASDADCANKCGAGLACHCVDGRYCGECRSDSDCVKPGLHCVGNDCAKGASHCFRDQSFTEDDGGVTYLSVCGCRSGSECTDKAYPGCVPLGAPPIGTNPGLCASCSACSTDDDCAANDYLHRCASGCCTN